MYLWTLILNDGCNLLMDAILLSTDRRAKLLLSTDGKIPPPLPPSYKMSSSHAFCDYTLTGHSKLFTLWRQSQQYGAPH